MDPFVELLLNAAVAGLLVGCFYAAVALGIAIVFGMLDIPNLAHPAFVILGAFAAWMLNTRLGLDPILAGIAATPLFFMLGGALYATYHACFERRGENSLQGLAFFFGILFITEVTLVLCFGADYRSVVAPYIGPNLRLPLAGGAIDLPLRMLVPCLVTLATIAVLHRFLTRSFTGRAILAVSQDPIALRLMGASPYRIKLVAFGIAIASAGVAGALLVVIEPVEPSIGRDLIGRAFAVVVLGGMGSFSGMLLASLLLGVTESVVSTMYDPSWAPAIAFGFLLPALALRRRALPLPSVDLGRSPRGRPPPWSLSNARFGAMALVGLVLAWAAGRFVSNDYVFFAGYIVLQYVLLATAWNILGGYAGYVNFGTAAFLALGAYVSVALNKLWALPLPVLIIAGGLVSGLIGLGMGYLTLRLRGVFFSIATLAVAIVVQALVTNWEYVGGASGAYVIRPPHGPFGGSYVEYLFYVMLAMTLAAIVLARTIERSSVGFGLVAIRDDELAAEACGVPTLRLKLLATAASGALMGMAGAPLPFYVAYLDPPSAFNLAYAVNTIAMPLVGGTGTWIGPVIGAVLLTGLQQTAMVTISSAANLLVVGLVMVGFVTLAPNGIVGLVRDSRRRRRHGLGESLA